MTKFIELKLTGDKPPVTCQNIDKISNYCPAENNATRIELDNGDYYYVDVLYDEVKHKLTKLGYM